MCFTTSYANDTVNAKSWYEIGIRHYNLKEYEAAAKAFQKGISALGKNYRNAQDIDDTETKLVLAKIRIKAGDWEQGATLLRNVLDSRLTLSGRLLHQ